jgi:hypothetical protein
MSWVLGYSVKTISKCLNNAVCMVIRSTLKHFVPRCPLSKRLPAAASACGCRAEGFIAPKLRHFRLLRGISIGPANAIHASRGGKRMNDEMALCKAKTQVN